MKARVETPQSSNIAAFEFDAQLFVLTVEFKNGTIYDFAGVAQAEFEEMAAAPSVGKHFNSHIKGRYVGVKRAPAVTTDDTLEEKLAASVSSCVAVSGTLNDGAARPEAYAYCKTHHYSPMNVALGRCVAVLDLADERASKLAECSKRPGCVADMHFPSCPELPEVPF